MVSTNPLPAPKTIIVPDDYPSIKDAIGNASAGDTILVRSGTYFENPIIDKPLTLQGENSANTIVVGTGDSVGASVFTIAADNVKISGFTITSVNYSASANYAYGVLIEGDNCMITGNNIVNTLSGIFCSVQSSTLIAQNNITGNHNAELNAIRRHRILRRLQQHHLNKQHNRQHGFRHRHRRLFRQYNRKQSCPKTP